MRVERGRLAESGRATRYSGTLLRRRPGVASPLPNVHTIPYANRGWGQMCRYAGDADGKGGIYNFVTKRGLCHGDSSKISWTQVRAPAQSEGASQQSLPLAARPERPADAAAAFRAATQLQPRPAKGTATLSAIWEAVEVRGADSFSSASLAPAGLLLTLCRAALTGGPDWGGPGRGRWRRAVRSRGNIHRACSRATTASASSTPSP